MVSVDLGDIGRAIKTLRGALSKLVLIYISVFWICSTVVRAAFVRLDCGEVGWLLYAYLGSTFVLLLLLNSGVLYLSVREGRSARQPLLDEIARLRRDDDE